MPSAKPIAHQRGSVASRPPAGLSDLEQEVIAHFVEISRALGQPRSYAEIYGLLFISPQPLTMVDLYERLQISKGSASQGLKFLRAIGAVRALETDSSRRTHYAAVAELRRLAGRFLRDQIAPQLAGSEARLARLEAGMGELPALLRDHAGSRITMLRSWNQNTRRILPLVVKILGG